MIRRAYMLAYVATLAALLAGCILAYAMTLADTTTRARELRDAAEQGCIINGQWLPADQQGDC